MLVSIGAKLCKSIGARFGDRFEFINTPDGVFAIPSSNLEVSKKLSVSYQLYVPKWVHGALGLEEGELLGSIQGKLGIQIVARDAIAKSDTLWDKVREAQSLKKSTIKDSFSTGSLFRYEARVTLRDGTIDTFVINTDENLHLMHLSLSQSPEIENIIYLIERSNVKQKV